MAVSQATATINGKPLTFETGKYAKQAGGAVTVRYGDTIVFAAGTVAKTTRPGIDFFPLTVDFEERLYAAGKIPGSFPRREGRPSEEGILTARLVDRPIRPLWPKGFKNDVQIIVSAWSADQENEYDILAVNAASAALHVSNAPFEGPIGCVRVGTVDGKLTLNPTIQQLEDSELDLVVAGTRDSVMMIEAGANQVSEDLLVEALALAQTGIKAICDAQEDLRKQAGKPKLAVTPPARDTAKLAPVNSFLKERLHAKLRNPDKAQRESGPATGQPAPVPAFISLALGSAYFRLERLPDAERMFRDAIAVQPKFGEAHSNLALVCLLTGRAAEAQDHVRIAEEAKFQVNPELKRQIREALGKTGV